MDGMVCGESKWKYGNGIDHIRVYTSMYTPGKPYTVDFLEVPPPPPIGYKYFGFGLAY